MHLTLANFVNFFSWIATSQRPWRHTEVGDSYQRSQIVLPTCLVKHGQYQVEYNPKDQWDANAAATTDLSMNPMSQTPKAIGTISIVLQILNTLRHAGSFRLASIPLVQLETSTLGFESGMPLESKLDFDYGGKAHETHSAPEQYQGRNL